MRTFKREHNFIFIALTTFLFFSFAQAIFAACPDDGAEPFTTGPVNPNNGFATYVQDSGSVLGAPLALEICLDGDGVTGPCIFDAVDPANPYSVQVGFGAEAFWFLATAVIDNPANNFSAELVQAVEAAWVAEVPGEGDQFPFTRLRIRLDVPAIGSYTVVHPYGQIIYEVNALEAGRDVNDPIDIPFAPNATNQRGRILPYLIWDPAIPPAAPAGYIGDPLVEHAVIGSPCGTNEFTVIPPAGVNIGAGAGNPVTQTLFTVQGKISTLFGVGVDRISYTRVPSGGGQVDIFASSQTGQTLEVSGIGNVNKKRTMIEDPLGSGKYFARVGFNATNGLPATATVTNLGDGIFVTVPVPDFIIFNQARYTTDTNTLEVKATSEDDFVLQEFEAFDDSDRSLGTFVSGATLSVNRAIPPNTVTVKSTGGGETSRAVLVRGQNMPLP